MASDQQKTHPSLSVRGMVIGGIGSAVISASSLYVALKLSALPWPLVFAALLSVFFLKLLGNTSLNEANVTHTAMSAGAMVAGGLAFTVPAVWIVTGTQGVSLGQVLVVSIAGVGLGLIATACIRHFFIDEVDLPYPIGVSAAETLKASDKTAAKESKVLFVSMALAAVYAWLRDRLELLPAMLFEKVQIPGVAFGVYNSPMMLAVGFLIGPLACFVWFLGALIGDMGIVVGGTAAGFWDITAAQGIKTSLGIGLMLGAGIGVVALQLIRGIKKKCSLRNASSSEASSSLPRSEKSARVTKQAASLKEHHEKPDSDQKGRGTAKSTAAIFSKKTALITAPLVSAAVAALVAWGLGFGLLPSVVLILGAWIAVLMSSQCVGVTGINPMEVFGIVVLLGVQVFFHELDMTSLFLIAAIVAVACGLTGDIMNDFKAGAMLGTSPRDQWIAQALGALIGAVVSSVVLIALVGAFGPESFGIGKEFSAAQASAVATMVSGIPDPAFFIVGLLVGIALAVCRIPCMTLGLGVYLPFYLSLTAFIGGLIKLIYDKATKKSKEASRTGTAIAAGLLGGESLIGVVMALSIMATSFFA